MDSNTRKELAREIEAFDAMIRKLAPRYEQMIDVLVSVIPFDEDRRFSVLDLGCGTGAVSKAIADRYPLAEITGVDLSENMLEMARVKLDGRIECIQADFNQFAFPRQYDLIVSSLAMHHLATDDDKRTFYRKIYAALSPGGQFTNIDIVAGASDALQQIYENKLADYMAEQITKEEFERDWKPKYGSVDFPVPILRHTDMMKDCGFEDIDIVYKNYRFAVYTGTK